MRAPILNVRVAVDSVGMDLRALAKDLLVLREGEVLNPAFEAVSESVSEEGRRPAQSNRLRVSVSKPGFRDACRGRL